MFKTVFLFELASWMRSRFLPLCLLFTFTSTYLSLTTDFIRIRSPIGCRFLNSPIAVQNHYILFCDICDLMIVAVAVLAASRDFTCRTTGIIFSTSVSETPWLLGRFAATAIVAAIPSLGILAGILLGSCTPWIDHERFTANSLLPHLYGLLLFCIPTTLLYTALGFVLTLRLKNAHTPLLLSALLIYANSLFIRLLIDSDYEVLPALLDPLGKISFYQHFQQWTAQERSTGVVGFTIPLLWNRLLWISLSCMLLMITCRTFDFSRQGPAESSRHRRFNPRRLRVATLAFDRVAAHLPKRLLQLLQVTFFNLRYTVLSPLLLIVTMYFLYFLSLPLFFDDAEFKTRSLPVTSVIIDQILNSSESATMFFIIVAAGLLVHRDRDARFHEIMDSLPHSAVVIPTGRLLALVFSVLTLPLIGIFTGILSQATRDYWHFQIPVYLSVLFGPVTWHYCCLAVSAMLVQTLTPGKISGYLAIIAFVSASMLITPKMDIGIGVPVFGAFPQVVYSDFYGYAPWFRSLLTTGIWNLLLFGLFHIAVILLWKRGVDEALSVRLTEIRKRLKGTLKFTTITLCGLTIGFMLIFLLNHPPQYVPTQKHISNAVQYEQLLRERFEHLPHPVVTSASYSIDLFPERRAFKLKTDLTLENTDSEPQTTVILNTRRGFPTTVRIDRGHLQEDYPDLMCSIYRLDPPLMKGESIHLHASVDYAPPAAELTLSNALVLQNGSFLQPDSFTLIGYRRLRELHGKTLRRENNLEDRSAQQPLDPTDQRARQRHMLDPYGHLVYIETVIGTAADQIAVAPGTLVKTWQQKDRQYFQYRMESPTVHNPVILSAKFKVAREVWNGVDTEIYYHPDHAWNVPDMMLGMHRTLEYGSRHFSPYQFSFSRVLEFPRVCNDTRGIAFPGIMPYSESSGFTSDLRDPASFNSAFYVVSHEVAHQWWGYQLLSADVEGGKFLAEALADYTAMMVLEQEFGAEITRRFLRNRTRHYLQSRVAETDSEHPLGRSRIDQDYLFYSKGSLVIYQLRQLIGEDRINTALRNLLQKFGGGNPPYATSLDLLESLRQQTPIEHHQILDELFNQITLFQNQTRGATAQKLANNTWQVTLQVECRKIKSDGDGTEQDIPFEQFVEVGAFSQPKEGRRFGEPLYQKQHLLKSGTNSITFNTTERPDTAGIDPFLLLIDRTPEDNVVEVCDP